MRLLGLLFLCACTSLPMKCETVSCCLPKARVKLKTPDKAVYLGVMCRY